MGRYLANGVLTRFDVRKKNGWWSSQDFDIKKEKYKILKEINKTIDTSLYNLINETDEVLEFALKPEVFNNNIHELIKEISDLTFPNATSFGDEIIDNKIDLNSQEFTLNYKFNCEVLDDGSYKIIVNDEEITEDYPCDPQFWMIRENRLFDNVKVTVGVILLWIDWNKYLGEDETNMLEIINKMKKSYYHSKLSNALLYYVAG